jgi:hypothetical protein
MHAHPLRITVRLAVLVEPPGEALVAVRQLCALGCAPSADHHRVRQTAVHVRQPLWTPPSSVPQGLPDPFRPAVEDHAGQSVSLGKSFPKRLEQGSSLIDLLQNLWVFSELGKTNDIERLARQKMPS